jgi:hypothetical protein
MYEKITCRLTYIRFMSNNLHNYVIELTELWLDYANTIIGYFTYLVLEAQTWLQCTIIIVVKTHVWYKQALGFIH